MGEKLKRKWIGFLHLWVDGTRLHLVIQNSLLIIPMQNQQHPLHLDRLHLQRIETLVDSPLLEIQAQTTELHDLQVHANLESDLQILPKDP